MAPIQDRLRNSAKFASASAKFSPELRGPADSEGGLPYHPVELWRHPLQGSPKDKSGVRHRTDCLCPQLNELDEKFGKKPLAVPRSHSTPGTSPPLPAASAPHPVRCLALWERFLLYGMLGWAFEILFTAIYDFAEGGFVDPRLTGKTYLWMFPIWSVGLMLGEGLARHLMEKRYGLERFLVYVAVAYAIEYGSGWLLQGLVGRCPWDYSGAHWAVHGLIRLDYAPAWALCGWTGEHLSRLFGQRLRLSLH